MKIFRISGGLGNQMFQYAFSLKFIEQEKVYYHIIEKTAISNHNFFQLDKLGLNLKSPNFLIRFLFCRNTIPFINKDFILLKRLYFSQKKSFERIDQISLSKKVYIEGNFIDPSDVLKRKIEFNFFKISKEKKESKSINVGIHLRFGDYLNDGNNKKFINLSKTNYYQNSLKHINKTLRNSNKKIKYLLVSDDKEKAVELFKEENYLFAGSTNVFEDLRTLINCDILIISNSTFSFWGALLGKQRIVCCPKRYLYEDIKINYPPTWDIIDI